MKLRYGRVVIAAIGSEVMAVVALIVIVVTFGPSEPAAVQYYAARLGLWVGPTAGFLFTLLAAWWVARPLQQRQVLHGMLTGVATAFIDIAILVAGSTEFQWIFVASNAGRIIAGCAGGWLALRSRAN